jgi:hypothetical protein
MATWRFLPGAVPANTAVALSPAAPDFLNLQLVLVETGPAGGVASTTSPVAAQIVTSVPSGGLTGTQIYFDAVNQTWQYGSATVSGSTIFTFEGPVYGEWGLTA